MTQTSEPSDEAHPFSSVRGVRVQGYYCIASKLLPGVILIYRYSCVHVYWNRCLAYRYWRNNLYACFLGGYDMIDPCYQLNV